MNRRPPRLQRLVPFALVLFLGLAGCATTPLHQRYWVALRTPHFEILSSLGDEATHRLAGDLEGFRAAAEHLWGAGIAPGPEPVRVLAFEGGGGGPFAWRSRTGYLIEDVAGDRLVLRGGSGWRGDARPELRLQVARRLYRNALAGPRPLWVEEGLAQLASQVEVRGSRAQLGIPHRELVRTLREELWIPLDRILSHDDISDWSDRERAMLEAESWLLSHYAKFSEQDWDRAGDSVARYLSALERGTAPVGAAESVWGDGLQRRLWRYLDAREMPTQSASIIQRRPRNATLRPVRLDELNLALGELALALDSLAEAERRFERVREDASERAAALRGLGGVASRRGDTDLAGTRFAEALALDPEDPTTHRLSADALRARAQNDPTRSEALRGRAREQYQRSLDLRESAAAHAGLAATYLDGDAPVGPAFDHIERARRRLPGDPDLAILEARLALVAGDTERARRVATQTVSRARQASDLEAARDVLDQLDARIARP